MMIAFSSKEFTIAAKGWPAAQAKAIAELRARAAALFEMVRDGRLPAGAEIRPAGAERFRLEVLARPSVEAKCGSWRFRAGVVVSVPDHHAGPALARLERLDGGAWSALLRASMPSADAPSAATAAPAVGSAER